MAGAMPTKLSQAEYRGGRDAVLQLQRLGGVIWVDDLAIQVVPPPAGMPAPLLEALERHRGAAFRLLGGRPGGVRDCRVVVVPRDRGRPMGAGPKAPQPKAARPPTPSQASCPAPAADPVRAPATRTAPKPTPAAPTPAPVAPAPTPTPKPKRRRRPTMLSETSYRLPRLGGGRRAAWQRFLFESGPRWDRLPPGTHHALIKSMARLGLIELHPNYHQLHRLTKYGMWCRDRWMRLEALRLHTGTRCTCFQMNGS